MITSKHQSSIEQTTRNRIGYIDALRGFTMLMVVCVHTATYSKIDIVPYSSFFQLFRMPLFFFISGLFFYKNDYIWEYHNGFKFIAKKFLVQIIPTAIFLSIYMIIFNIKKFDIIGLNGYWFTVALFEFFTVYILCNILIKNQIISNILLFICAIILYLLSYNTQSNFHYSYGYFIFFIIGIISKKHLDKITHIFDNNIIMLVVILLMFIGSILFLKGNFVNLGVKLLLSLLGIYSIYYFFMKNGEYINNSKIGKCMQFVGRRTLDIYLLHYFFVHDSMSWIVGHGVDSPTLLFIISIFTSIVIIGISLLLSKFLRTNPLLGKILFGVKLPMNASKQS